MHTDKIKQQSTRIRFFTIPLGILLATSGSIYAFEGVPTDDASGADAIAIGGDTLAQRAIASGNAAIAVGK